MSYGAHTISPKHGSGRTKKRVGRGNASQKGTTAGRGTKGQKARSGGKGGKNMIGMKQSILKVPKTRGFVSMHPKAQTVTLSTLERISEDGVTVTPAFLKQKTAIKSVAKPVKIVSTGTLTKKVQISGCLATQSAKAAIEKAGGSLSN